MTPVPSLADRFHGDDGRRRLVAVLKRQTVVNGDDTVAALLAESVQTKSFEGSDVLIAQDGTDTDLFFLLSGSVSIIVNHQEVARRHAGQHVGEMALIDPSARRSADVVAREPVVAAVISEADFVAVANANPHIWRCLAVELGDRLRQRNNLVRLPNDSAVVFIGSSSEALPIADAIAANLRRAGVTVRPWTHPGVFNASHFPMEDLEAQLNSADFAVLVCHKDDVVTSRGKRRHAPRDNVVFELGLFMGAITRPRTFLAKPKGVDVKIPTDLLGMTCLEYPEDLSHDIHRKLRSTCTALRDAVASQGPR